jgi:hypothetical protein
MLPADGDRLALQCRIVTLLHGRIEGVHVDMDDLPALARSPVLRERAGVRVWLGHEYLLSYSRPESLAMGATHGVAR